MVYSRIFFVTMVGHQTTINIMVLHVTDCIAYNNRFYCSGSYSLQNIPTSSHNRQDKSEATRTRGSVDSGLTLCTSGL